MRRVFLMNDYYAWPVWDYPSRVGTAEEDLPLTAETVAALRAWAVEYDTRMSTADFEAPYDEDAHEREGRRLLKRVRDELGPAWKVGYFNYATTKIEWD